MKQGALLETLRGPRLLVNIESAEMNVRRVRTGHTVITSAEPGDKSRVREIIPEKIHFRGSCIPAHTLSNFSLCVEITLPDARIFTF